MDVNICGGVSLGLHFNERFCFVCLLAFYLKLRKIAEESEFAEDLKETYNLQPPQQQQKTKQTKNQQLRPVILSQSTDHQCSSVIWVNLRITNWQYRIT